MSVAKAQIQAKKEGKRKASALDYLNGSAGTNADWSKASGDAILDLVVVITELGGAVRFGCSRDGGAFAIGLYVSDDSRTIYLPCTGDVDDWINETAHALTVALNASRGSKADETA